MTDGASTAIRKITHFLSAGRNDLRNPGIRNTHVPVAPIFTSSKTTPRPVVVLRKTNQTSSVTGSYRPAHLISPTEDPR
jgi:hypothetical protein